MSGPVVSVILERAARLPYADRRHLVRELARGLILSSMVPRTPGASLPASTASGEDMVECIIADLQSLLPEPVSPLASTAALMVEHGGQRDIRAEESGGNGSRHGAHTRRVKQEEPAA
jgi:hypothetical protein